MSEENVSGALSSADVASAMVKNPDIRKLSPGSEEYIAAVTKLTENQAEAPASEAKVEETTDDSDGQVEEKKKSSKTGLEQRFSKITGERDEARRKAAELEARLAALESAAAKTESKPAERVESQGDQFTKSKPDVGSYDSYSEYQEALVDWKLEKKEFEAEQNRVQAEQAKVQDERKSSWDKRTEATKSRVEGYDVLVDQDFVRDFATASSSEARQFILESENGPDLLYELAEDEAKLAGFKSMSNVKQVAYLAKLEAKYEQAGESTINKPVVTKAPAPSKSLPKGNAVVVKDMTKGVTSFADYTEWRKQQRKN